MKTGVIGDIQGNHEALTAVLGELQRRGVTRVVCVGDIVGYNADPNECVALVRRRCAAALAGAHDLMALGRLDFAGCSTQMEYALRRTRRELDPEAKAWLASLPVRGTLHEGGEDALAVNPGSVDASRSRGPRLAQCALYDSRSMTVEFLHVPYDSAAAEAKATVFGYRINGLTDQLYTFRRLIGRGLPARKALRPLPGNPPR